MLNKVFSSSLLGCSLLGSFLGRPLLLGAGLGVGLGVSSGLEMVLIPVNEVAVVRLTALPAMMSNSKNSLSIKMIVSQQLKVTFASCSTNRPRCLRSLETIIC